MIRVLIVDDSLVSISLLEKIMGEDPEIEVVGSVNDGIHALDAVKKYKPDVVTMDIHMRYMNGFDATRSIMEEEPVPIIIVSGSYNSQDNFKAFKALEMGAVTILKKPHGITNPEFEADAKQLVNYVKMMSEIKVIKRRFKSRPNDFIKSIKDLPRRDAKRPEVLAIGASTGGPAVIQQILLGIQENLPIPIVIVQHIASGFTDSLVSWLRASTGYDVVVAKAGEIMRPGKAYIAPDNHSIFIGMDQRINLSYRSPDDHTATSVSDMFNSVADAFRDRALGVLLTGMGKDGALELKRLRNLGAVTVAQSEKSSTVFGMPAEAIKLNAAEYVLDPSEIILLIRMLVNGYNEEQE